MKRIIIIVIILFVGAAGLALMRGDEDTWVCEQGVWVKHGNPSTPAPKEKCGEEKEGWAE